MPGDLISVAGELSCVAGELSCVAGELSCVAGDFWPRATDSAAADCVEHFDLDAPKQASEAHRDDDRFGRPGRTAPLDETRLKELVLAYF